MSLTRCEALLEPRYVAYERSFRVLDIAVKNAVPKSDGSHIRLRLIELPRTRKSPEQATCEMKANAAASEERAHVKLGHFEPFVAPHQGESSSFIIDFGPKWHRRSGSVQ